MQRPTYTDVGITADGKPITTRWLPGARVTDLIVGGLHVNTYSTVQSLETAIGAHAVSCANGCGARALDSFGAPCANGETVLQHCGEICRDGHAPERTKYDDGSTMRVGDRVRYRLFSEGDTQLYGVVHHDSAHSGLWITATGETLAMFESRGIATSLPADRPDHIAPL